MMIVSVPTLPESLTAEFEVSNLASLGIKMNKRAYAAALTHNGSCQNRVGSQLAKPHEFTISRIRGFINLINFQLRRFVDKNKVENIADFDLMRVGATRFLLWHRFVEDDHRNEGHGTRMLQSMETYAHSICTAEGSRSSPELFCSTDPKSDVASWLEKNGYEELQTPYPHVHLRKYL